MDAPPQNPEPGALLVTDRGGWYVDRYSPLITPSFEERRDFLFSDSRCSFEGGSGSTDAIIRAKFNGGDVPSEGEFFQTQDRIHFRFSPDEPGSSDPEYPRINRKCYDIYDCAIAQVGGFFNVDLDGPYRAQLWWDIDPTDPVPFEDGDGIDDDLVFPEYEEFSGPPSEVIFFNPLSDDGTSCGKLVFTLMDRGCSGLSGYSPSLSTDDFVMPAPSLLEERALYEDDIFEDAEGNWHIETWKAFTYDIDETVWGGLVSGTEITICLDNPSSPDINHLTDGNENEIDDDELTNIRYNTTSEFSSEIGYCTDDYIGDFPVNLDCYTDISDDRLCWQFTIDTEPPELVGDPPEVLCDPVAYSSIGVTEFTDGIYLTDVDGVTDYDDIVVHIFDEVSGINMSDFTATIEINGDITGSSEIVPLSEGYLIVFWDTDPDIWGTSVGDTWVNDLATITLHLEDNAVGCGPNTTDLSFEVFDADEAEITVKVPEYPTDPTPDWVDIGVLEDSHPDYFFDHSEHFDEEFHTLLHTSCDIFKVKFELQGIDPDPDTPYPSPDYWFHYEIVYYGLDDPSSTPGITRYSSTSPPPSSSITAAMCPDGYIEFDLDYTDFFFSGEFDDGIYEVKINGRNDCDGELGENFFFVWDRTGPEICHLPIPSPYDDLTNLTDVAFPIYDISIRPGDFEWESDLHLDIKIYKVSDPSTHTTMDVIINSLTCSPFGEWWVTSTTTFGEYKIHLNLLELIDPSFFSGLCDGETYNLEIILLPDSSPTVSVCDHVSYCYKNCSRLYDGCTYIYFWYGSRIPYEITAVTTEHCHGDNTLCFRVFMTGPEYLSSSHNYVHIMLHEENGPICDVPEDAVTVEYLGSWEWEICVNLDDLAPLTDYPFVGAFLRFPTLCGPNLEIIELECEVPPAISFLFNPTNLHPIISFRTNPSCVLESDLAEVCTKVKWRIPHTPSITRCYHYPECHDAYHLTETFIAGDDLIFEALISRFRTACYPYYYFPDGPLYRLDVYAMYDWWNGYPHCGIIEKEMTYFYDSRPGPRDPYRFHRLLADFLGGFLSFPVGRPHLSGGFDAISFGEFPPVGLDGYREVKVDIGGDKLIILDAVSLSTANLDTLESVLLGAGERTGVIYKTASDFGKIVPGSVIDNAGNNVLGVLAEYDTIVYSSSEKGFLDFEISSSSYGSGLLIILPEPIYAPWESLANNGREVEILIWDDGLSDWVSIATLPERLYLNPVVIELPNNADAAGICKYRISWNSAGYWVDGIFFVSNSDLEPLTPIKQEPLSMKVNGIEYPVENLLSPDSVCQILKPGQELTLVFPDVPFSDNEYQFVTFETYTLSKIKDALAPIVVDMYPPLEICILDTEDIVFALTDPYPTDAGTTGYSVDRVDVSELVLTVANVN
ncbi:hypothetical protein DRQ36_08320, partial [bacterium]